MPAAPRSTESVSLVIPFQSTCPHRLAAFERVCSWYALVFPHAELVIVDDARIAPGRNEGVARAKHDVIFLSDADSLVSAENARAAVAVAAGAHGIVIAHDRFVYLNRRSSEHLLRASRYPRRLPLAPGTFDVSGPNGVSNAVVFHRSVWEKVGGWDERFVGWGREDSAYALACGTLVGRHARIPGDVYHFWHPSHGRVENEASMELHFRYSAAAEQGPAAMLRLLAEPGGPLSPNTIRLSSARRPRRAAAPSKE